ncbi:hypothetical protein [Saccharopolyspora hattusasensis]
MTEYLLMRERDDIAPLNASQADVSGFVPELTERPLTNVTIHSWLMVGSR